MVPEGSQLASELKGAARCNGLYYIRLLWIYTNYMFIVNKKSNVLVLINPEQKFGYKAKESEISTTSLGILDPRPPPSSKNENLHISRTSKAVSLIQ